MEDSLHREPDRFRQMLETLPLSVYTDRPGDPASFSYVSPQIEVMFGYSLEDWREDSFLARILHPDDQERVLAERKAVLADGSRRASFDYRIVNAGGSPLWVRDEVVVVADQESQSVHLQGFLIDVTESVRRRRELEAVSLIAASAGNVRDMREFYEEMHRVVGDLTRADNCYVALYDEELDRLNYPYYVDLVDADLPDPRVWEPAGRGLTAYVLRTGRPLRADREVRRDLRERGEIEDVGADAVDWLGIPLRVEDRVLGVLAIQSYDERIRYDDEDQAVLTAIGGHIAAAIRHADLQREQRESERRYRQLVEAIPVAMYRSPEGEQNSSEYMSERAVAMFGYPIESWADPDFYGTVLHPDDRDWVLAENDLPLTEDESVWVSEYRMVTADGRTIWIHDESWTVRDEDGKAQFVQGCMIDITAQQDAALEINRQKQYFEALVELSPVAIVVTDRDELITGWNPAATELFGYLPDEALGRTIAELLLADAELADEGAAVSREALSSGRAQRITRRSRKDGSLVDVEMLMAALMIDGEHTGYYVMYHDITELLRARQEAEEATQAKSAFLATMSHEIRTPMNAVIGMTGLLLDTDLDPEQRGFAQVISSSGDALLHIIDDILDYSKIEAGRLELESQPFDLRDCVESALEIVAPRAVGKDVELACLIEDDVPAFVLGDSTRLRQVLLNLLSNAVKFTERGEIVVSVRLAQPGQAHLSVRDTGIGIPKDRMHRLFESFSQVDASTTRRYGGTGLGLAISQRLVELMGGTIEVESEPGVGSTFHLTIRAEAAQTASKPAYARLGQPDLEGKRVLIVDDNATNREILSRQAASWGMHPEAHETPAEALLRLRRGEEYDVAVLDMQMPEMDGVTLAGEIRRLRDSLPLVLASSLAGLQQARTTAEFAVQLTKPIKASQLYEALLEALGAAGLVDEMGDPDVAPAADASSLLRILVAEDNAVNQRLATLLLGKLGYTADLVGNGLEALEAIATERYDLVLMDVQMPELDGLETTRRIIAEYGVDRPRIVAMTANAMESDRAECFAAGMDDYVAKPIRPDELAGALARCKPRDAD